MNIYDFAMQLELDSKAHYEKLGAETPVAGLKVIFSILAANELKHYDTMHAMKTGTPAEMADSAALEHAQSMFQTLRLDGVPHGELRTTLDAFRHAMEMESESIRLYEEIARKEGDNRCNPEAIQLLLQIVEEEKKHYEIVGKIHGLIAHYASSEVMHVFGKHKDI